MRKRIEPLSKSEIIKLDQVMERIRYLIKRDNIFRKLKSGYCRIGIIDFTNDAIVLEAESKVDNEISWQSIMIERKTMRPMNPEIFFNIENN